MRSAAILLVVVAWLVGCEGDQLNRPTTVLDSPRPLNDPGTVAGATGGEQLPFATDNTASSLVTVRYGFVGASPNGQEADVRIAYTVHAGVLPYLQDNSELAVHWITPNDSPRLLAIEPLDDESLSGELVVTVPIDDASLSSPQGGQLSERELRISLQGLADGSGNTELAYSSIRLPSAVPRPITDLDRLNSLRVSLVPGSYSSALDNGRRRHRFAIQVEGTSSVRDKPTGVDPGTWIGVAGLEHNVPRHFHAVEFDYEDPESSITVDASSEKLDVYLVMDQSSSISQSGGASQLLDAVSRTVIALGRVADFDYRVFSSEVFDIPDTRSLSFERDDSGTAFYRALDLTLNEIEDRSGPDRDVVVVAFTDGRDLASRNFYPAFRDHDEVRDYILSRLRNVAQVQREFLGRRMETYVISLGDDVDQASLDALDREGDITHIPARDYSNVAIRQSFARMINQIRSVYYLEYSSQQTLDDTDLVVNVVIGDLQERIRLPTRFESPD